MKQYARLRVADFFNKSEGAAVFVPSSSALEMKSFATSQEAFDYIGAMLWDIVQVETGHDDMSIFYLQRDLVGAE